MQNSSLHMSILAYRSKYRYKIYIKYRTFFLGMKEIMSIYYLLTEISLNETLSEWEKIAKYKNLYTSFKKWLFKTKS